MGATGLALLVLLAMAPRVGLPVLFAVMVGTRTAWRVRRSLYERRIARGYQPSDRWVMAAGTPWHLFVTSLRSVFHLVWVGLAGFLAGAVVALAEPNQPRLPYVAGAAVAVLLTWVGPGTGRVRNGARILTAPLDRDPRAGWVVAVAMAVLIWVQLLIWDSYGTGWPPFAEVSGWVDAIRALLGQ